MSVMATSLSPDPLKTTDVATTCTTNSVVTYSESPCPAISNTSTASDLPSCYTLVNA